MMIRRMEEKDLEKVADLEKVCFSAPWTAGILRQALDQKLDSCWVLETDGHLPAYAVLRILAGEGEIQRIAVHPAFRGRGYARELMDKMTSFSRQNGAGEMILEVRAGNKPAVNLYKSYGFREEAVRKDYYDHPTEDALLMRRKEV